MYKKGSITTGFLFFGGLVLLLVPLIMFLIGGAGGGGVGGFFDRFGISQKDIFCDVVIQNKLGANSIIKSESCTNEGKKLLCSPLGLFDDLFSRFVPDDF